MTVACKRLRPPVFTCQPSGSHDAVGGVTNQIDAVGGVTIIIIDAVGGVAIIIITMPWVE